MLRFLKSISNRLFLEESGYIVTENFVDKYVVREGDKSELLRKRARERNVSENDGSGSGGSGGSSGSGGPGKQPTWYQQQVERELQKVSNNEDALKHLVRCCFIIIFFIFFFVRASILFAFVLIKLHSPFPLFLFFLISSSLPLSHTIRFHHCVIKKQTRRQKE